jgi:signal transduction histidine kinase
VRTFIIGLEPPALEGKTLAQAIASLADGLRSIRAIQIDTDIDEIATESLPESLRIHIVQLVREAFLNSLRHTGATRLHLSLQSDGEHLRLTLIDDGSSVAPTASSPAAQGLASLAARVAIIGASCEISPLPSRGNRIRVRYPQPFASR